MRATLSKLLWSSGLLLVCATFSSAQVTTAKVELPPIDVAMPPGTFDNLKEEDTEGEEFNEYSFSFQSFIETPYPENNKVPVRFFVPKERKGPVPAVIILHYWGATDLRLERAMASELAHRQVASAIVTLPYHLARAPKGTRSGELAIQADPELLRNSMTQSVLDVRRALEFLRSREEIDRTKTGILGTSLGSIVAANVYAVDTELSSAAFLLGGIDLAHIVWHSSRIVKERDTLRARGFTEAKMRAELAPVEPMNWLKNRTTGKAFVVGGRFDTVVPPADTNKLISMLPNVQTLTLDTGHYGGIFVQKRLMDTAAEFLSHSFAGDNYKSPSKIYAPTLRIVAAASTINPIDIGIGIDFLTTRNREFIGSFLLTPRGPQLFFGTQLDKSVSIGVFGSSKKAGVGLLWSTVL